MDVENLKDEAASKENNTSQLDIGALLVEARNNAGLKSEDIATALNLSQEIITKIEANIFEQDLPIAFVRGYVKSYVTKVGLDTQPILKAFDKVTGVAAPSLKRVESLSSFGTKTREFNSSSSLFKIVSLVIILLFVTFGGWELWKRYLKPTFFEFEQSIDGANPENGNAIDLTMSSDGLTTDSSTKINVTESLSKTESLSESGLINDDPDAVISTEKNINDTEVEKSLSASQIQTTGIENNSGITPTTVPLSTNNQEQSASLRNMEQFESPDNYQQETQYQFSDLTFDFSADCWVKITDSRGEVLAVGIKRDGKHMSLKAVAPIVVVLGDPSGVTMNYNNNVYDLSNYPSGRRAKITLN